MRIYHAPGTRSNRLVWLCAELGLDAEIVPENMRKLSDDLVALNPSKSLPVMVDGDKVITESVAAMIYIASQHGAGTLGVSPEEPGYADYLQFAILGEAGLMAPLNALIGTRFMAPEGERENFTTRAIEHGISTRAKLVAKKLESSAFLAADRFTVADISVAFAVGVGAHMLGLKDKFPPSVLDHHARMTARPAYLASCGSK